jgi:phage anti-repressor protein
MNNKVSIFANDVNAPVKVELNDNGQYFVSARELYAFLGVNSKFADWIKNRIAKYNFMENKDYISFSKILENGGREKEYNLSVSMAKELTMVEHNAKGREVRLYFIKCEEKLQDFQALLLEAQTHEISSLYQKVNSLCQDMNSLREDLEYTKYLINGNFQKAEAYVIDLEERHDKRFEKLEENHYNAKSSLDTTVNRVDKIEERLDFKADAYVYVMYCPRRQWYKLGSSHDTKGRKKDFAIIEPNLQILIEIPMISRPEAYNFENTLKRRFSLRHKEGEWYLLLSEDIEYLHEVAQSNRIHLLRIAEPKSH